jgi:hypothetical protein
MLTISKALSAKQAQTYHAREFASEQQNYWSQNRQATANGVVSLPKIGIFMVLFMQNTSQT